MPLCVAMLNCLSLIKWSEAQASVEAATAWVRGTNERVLARIFGQDVRVFGSDRI
jgi:hypothetical protein